MMTKTESKQIDRYEGAMLGVAVGDALGAPLEFMEAEEIKARYGRVTEMIGGGWLSVEPGEVTDDTQMTLAVAEGIIAEEYAERQYRQIGENFLHWYETGPKDVGGTCSAVLSEMRSKTNHNLDEWHNTAYQLEKRTNGRTAGNGALMRTIYPALYWKAGAAAHHAVKIARMTHYSDNSCVAVQQYTQAVNKIVWGDMDEEAARKLVADTFRALIETGDRGKQIQPSGYSLDSAYWAAKAVIDTESFEEAVGYAVNLGGDADTIGAITGGLAGAIYGATKIPLRWINKLQNQPNRETAELFWDGAKTMGNGANVLAVRLIGLAHRAYDHRKSEV